MAVTGADTRATRLSMLAAGLALAHQVAAKSLREGVFLSTFSVKHLPLAMLGAALFAIPSALLVARLMSRLGPARLAPAMFVISGLLSFTEWWLLPVFPRPVAMAVYLHVSIGGALVVSAFWSIINERFDPHTLKYVVGRIGASCTLGGLVGGLLMERVVHWSSARSGLLLIGLLAMAAAICTQQVAVTVPTTKLVPEEARSRERLSSYLRTLALLVACTAAASAFGDFALKQAAVQRFTGEEPLVRFFAVFYTVSSLVGFLVQAFLSQRLLDAIGVGGTLATPPLIAVVLGGLALFSPTLLMVGALRGSDLALGPSLFRSSFEPLFTPVSRASKRRSKALIDVVFDKGGDASASLLILGLLSGGTALVLRAPLALAVVFWAFAAFLSLRAQRGYVVALESSLRAGTLHQVTDPDDARLLRSAAALGIDHDKLVEQIARLREAKSEPEIAAVAPPLDAAPPTAPVEQVVADVGVLLGTDVNAIRGVLERESLDARLAAFVLPHLAEDELVKPAVVALRKMGSGALGVLAEAMHSSSLPDAVRRRVPHVLRSARGERVARVLFGALTADTLEVRHRAALALAEVTRDERAWLPAQSQIDALVLSEVNRGSLDRSTIDYLFALLELGLDKGALELARQGVLSDDPKLRGTALEYLESLLPETIRSPLVTALGERGPRSVRGRQPDASLDELRNSFQPDLAPPSLPNEPD